MPRNNGATLSLLLLHRGAGGSSWGGYMLDRPESSARFKDRAVRWLVIRHPCSRVHYYMLHTLALVPSRTLLANACVAVRVSMARGVNPRASPVAVHVAKSSPESLRPAIPLAQLTGAEHCCKATRIL